MIRKSNVIAIVIAMSLVSTSRVHSMQWLCRTIAATRQKKIPAHSVENDIKEAFEKTGLLQEIWPLICAYYNETTKLIITMPDKHWLEGANDWYHKASVINVAFEANNSILSVLVTGRYNGRRIYYRLSDGKMIDEKRGEMGDLTFCTANNPGTYWVATELINDGAMSEEYEAKINGVVNDLAGDEVVFDTGKRAILGRLWYNKPYDEEIQPRTTIDIFGHPGKKLAKILGVSLLPAQEEGKE